MIMEEEGGGFRLSKKSSDKAGEVDYKTKAGTAWSHSFLNQKPWHPLSYPNQRRKWIAEQTHSQKQRRAEEVAREYAQEQEFLRQTALISKKEKEKLEMMKAISFMYVKPPGYNAESAKAAEMADEKKKQEDEKILKEPSVDGASSSMKKETMTSTAEKRKPVPKDVFGRPLPTEEQFEVLKNAPRLETGVPGRVKPFGIEIRNVKCLRCGNYGHQSGDRECPLKDAIMPNEESRLKRDDPLTAIQAQTDGSEPLKWELKQKPGMSPPRGGFDPDDPNQQIVAEDIFDEYGGFLGEANIPELLINFSSSKTKKKSSKSKHRRRQSSPAGDERRDDQGSGSSSGDDRRKSKSKKRHKRKKRKHSETSSSESSDDNRHKKRRNRHKHRHSSSSDASDSDDLHRSRHNRRHRHSHRHRDQHRHHNHRPGSGSSSD
ncbi:uncharacterized zinc finger CCHC domain-containing protein At4g19190 [Sesamum indicum]|uniref:Uncharacterized zinc finger CCHC domain-containing protein At4g19190 n=1 Tax=Sesamum indicum TaxID=4182 RepID=A0A6I9SP21_SESIN|nr:uncharacterized zinc finger CCHC domain-containing protein At4g19190 [Sesamum indicum]